MAFCRNAQVHPIKYIQADISSTASLRGLNLPEGFNQFLYAHMGSHKPKPHFPQPVVLEWYDHIEDLTCEAKAKDLAWILCRQHNTDEQGFHHGQGSTMWVTAKHIPRPSLVRCC